MSKTATKLRAYHGDSDLKDSTVELARLGREADEFVHGLYYKENGGREFCAVGCLTHDPEGGHHLYPERWGIPEWLAHLEDGIFEGLPIEKAKLWPERFLSAIPVGADFDGLADRLAIRRLKEECLPLSGQWPESVRAEVVAAIEQTVAALEGKGDRSAARFAARSAWSAAESAWSAAGSARSAAGSARSAAGSARSAAGSARSAAESARSAAGSARSAAGSAAESGAYEREADRVVTELEALSTS